MKSSLAEWLLSQVLPPDRAASTVGDWMEDAAERGNLWFWCCVIQMAVSRVWSDLTEYPLTMVRRGLTGFGFNMLVPIGSLVLMFFLLICADGRDIDIRYRHNWILTYLVTNTVTDPSLPGRFDFTWPLQLAMQLVWAWRLFLTGRWIARRAPGREVAGCLSIALIGWLTILAAKLWATYGTGLFRPTLASSTIPMGIAHDIILLAGALWQRRRQLHPVG